jgi:hypothetical protein
MNIFTPLAADTASRSFDIAGPWGIGLDRNELAIFEEVLSLLLPVLRTLALELKNRAGYRVASRRPVPRAPSVPL